MGFNLIVYSENVASNTLLRLIHTQPAQPAHPEHITNT